MPEGEAKQAVKDFYAGKLGRIDISRRETELTSSLDDLHKSIDRKAEEIRSLEEKVAYEHKLLKIYQSMLELMGDMDD